MQDDTRDQCEKCGKMLPANRMYGGVCRACFVGEMDERPHGEHPSLGKCDCDDCQAWDMEQS